ncbi:class II aldolase/adducin family protein [Ilumatobacter sp.]
MVPLTWGNASGRTADGEFVAIRQNGVPYTEMKPEHMVVPRSPAT